MMRSRKVKAVATFEFLSEVRRPSYLVMVLGMPLFLMAYGALIGVVGILNKSASSKAKTYGVVDRAAVLNLQLDGESATPPISEEARRAVELFQGNNGTLSSEVLAGQQFVFRPFDDEPSAMDALRSRTIDGWFFVPADYLETGIVDSYFSEAHGLGTRDPVRVLQNLLRERLLRGNVSEPLAGRIREPFRSGKSWIVTSTGELADRNPASTIARFAVPFAFTILLFIAIIGGGMSLIQGTAVEKENRVVDVLLSSASADEILAGKLLGQGAAGLVQVSVWFAMAGVGGILFASPLAAMGVEVAWGSLGVTACYFVAAYFFVGSLMLGTGALGNTAKEGQQWSILWILLMVLPMMFIEVILRDAHGAIAQFLTWFPFTAAPTATIRLWTDPSGLRWWEIVGPLVVLIVATRLVVRLAARLFRLGLLLTGSRLKLAEIFRQIRLSG